MSTFQFTPYELPPEAKALRGEVRAFLKDALGTMAAADRARSWSGGSREFSKKLGARGWIGMTWPKQYGGHERSYAERYVVIEELLVAGAPVSSHWVADRQSGLLLLRFGTEEQRQTLLPAIARGELSFCIGMSEPGSGSDLASVRTRGRKVDGGWKVSGQKIWTSGAQSADWMIALVRTGDAEQRHAGLSQLLVDMKSPGLIVKPIANLTGESHFNEVFFDDVFVPENRLIGAEGGGWAQVGAELAYERSGPERYLSSIRLFLEFLRVVGDKPSEAERLLIGAMTARMWTLRQGVAVGHGQAGGRREPGGGRRGGEGSRHLVRAGHSARRAGDCAIGRRSVPAHADLSVADLAILLAARRYARKPARHHRARTGAQMSEGAHSLPTRPSASSPAISIGPRSKRRASRKCSCRKSRAVSAAHGRTPSWSCARAVRMRSIIRLRRLFLDSTNVNDRDLYMAMMLAAKMAGALNAALDLSVQYTRERQQFGKPLASFQAIQQQLAVFAEEAAAADMAAASAFRAADRGDAWFEIACAKLRANQAARTSTGIAPPRYTARWASPQNTACSI